MSQFVARIQRTLAAAALRGELPWAEVDDALTVLERAVIVADDRWWAIYEALDDRPRARRRVAA